MIAQDLTAAIEAAAEPKSPNRLSAERLRELVRDYLSRRQERLADRPDRLREDHYTFWAADWDPEGEHMFAFAVFVGESVTIAVGRGQVPDVVRFIELEFDGTPGELIGRLARRFNLAGGTIVVDREALERWLGLSVVT